MFCPHGHYLHWRHRHRTTMPGSSTINSVDDWHQNISAYMLQKGMQQERLFRASISFLHFCCCWSHQCLLKTRGATDSTIATFSGFLDWKPLKYMYSWVAATEAVQCVVPLLPRPIGRRTEKKILGRSFVQKCITTTTTRVIRMFTPPSYMNGHLGNGWCKYS